jgi:hypothetical protein
MIPLRLGLAAIALPAVLAAQAPTLPPYRGFTPGRPYKEFADRARALAGRETLTCNTSRKTAQLMECGVLIRDPSDSARFYLSAYVLEGNIAMVSLTDSGGPRLVEWARRDLTAKLGPPTRRERSMLEWSKGRRVARLNWRGTGQTRWISITLRDDEVMDRIARFVKRPAKRTR